MQAYASENITPRSSLWVLKMLGETINWVEINDAVWKWEVGRLYRIV